MKMRMFYFPVRLILCILVAGLATTFIDGWISHPPGGVDGALSLESRSAGPRATVSSGTIEQIHSAFEGWLATPASAGDLNGDVQGD